MATQPAVLDVTDETFRQTVLDQSHAKPVVVDFWAPWCGPCRMLSPIIERVASSFGGEVVLAKLNTDENPRTAAEFGIRSIPAVKAFRQGRVVDEFVGALPEPQVRAFFQKLAPSPAEQMASQADALARAGDLAGAERLYREVLQSAPNHADAIVGLARILIGRGEVGEAEGLLKRVPTDRRAKVLRHRLFLDGFAERHGNEDLERQARENPADPRARYRWGVMLAARERYDEALAELLESVRLDPNFADGAARQAILAVFDILGLDSPLTREYQRHLASLLF
ncbi:MAG TPA: thioredoxin [Dehalococcoidia bacterium]|nr:thioredoxin [Dehalococcoidia bacterium]